MRRGGLDFAPLWVLKAMIALGTLLAAAGCVFSGSTTTGFAFLFLWVTPYAVYFGLRQAAFQTVLAVLGLIGSRVALADGGFDVSQLGGWLLPTATIIVVSSIVHQLTRELGRSDRERIVSESERAEAEARRAASERERAHREAAMARLAGLALRATDRALLLDETVRVLTETLRVEHCAIRELQPDGTHMDAVAAIGFEIGAEVPADEQRFAGHVLAGDEPDHRLGVGQRAALQRPQPARARDPRHRRRGHPRALGRLRRHRRALGHGRRVLRRGGPVAAVDRRPAGLGARPRALGGGHAPPVAARRAHRPAQPRAALRPRRARLRPRRSASASASPCCCSTSTASRRSTTRSATRPATSC